jgi:AcrR family transcriptional regulator
LDSVGNLIGSYGPLAVTMSQIAKETGIGRATLYKYFPDVESVLIAWHQRHVAVHVAQLNDLRTRAGGPGARLKAVLKAYAVICQQRRRYGDDITTLIHRQGHLAEQQRQLINLISDLLADAAAAAIVRDDVPPHELASYCVRALTAAGDLSSAASVDRLVDVVLSGLRHG